MPIIVDPAALNPATGITITRVWLNAVDNPTDLIALRIYQYDPAIAVPGEIRQLAGDRLRLVTNGSAARSHTIQIRRPTDAVIAWLEDHAGHLVTVRDPDGRKYVGTYLALTPSRPIEGADLTLAVSEVTRSEAV